MLPCSDSVFSFETESPQLVSSMNQKLLVKEWNVWSKDFVEVVKSSGNKRAIRDLKKLAPDYPDKKLKITGSSVGGWNELLNSLDGESRERFLRKMRDIRYEQTRARISIRVETKKKLDGLIAKTRLKNHDELILFLIENQKK